MTFTLPYATVLEEQPMPLPGTPARFLPSKPRQFGAPMYTVWSSALCRQH